VVRLDKVRVFLEAPDTDAVLVREGPKNGSQARIRVPVLNDREFTGQVTGTSWSLEGGQRTLRTEIDLENPEGVLRPGMYAHALIEIEQANAWVLPTSALQTRDGQTFCYLARDGKAVQTLVRAGPRESTAVQVLKLQAGRGKPGAKPRWDNFTGTETIITGSSSDLSDGEQVRIEENEPAATQ